MPATPFADRSHAGRLLAAELAPFADRRPIVFGLPRCGVPVAYEIARHLGAPLDVALVRTVRTPDDRRQLLATILEGDPPEVRIEPDWDKSQTVSRAWLDQQVSEALAEVDRRRRRDRRWPPKPAPSGSPRQPTRWSACAAMPSSARSANITAGPSRSATKKR